MRKLNVNVDDILSLIACAEDYGFIDNVLFSSFSDFLNNKLSDEEIKLFLDGFNRDDYSDEDLLHIKNILLEFRRDFIGN